MRWYRSKFDNIRSAPLRNIGAATIEAAHNRCPDKFRNPSEYQPERRIEGKGYESRDTNHRPTPGFAVEQTAEIAKSGSSQDQPKPPPRPRLRTLQPVGDCLGRACMIRTMLRCLTKPVH